MSIKIKQRDITDCGAACLASVANYYNLKIPVARIRQYAGTDQKGTNILGLIQAAEKLGFSAKGVKGNVEALLKIPLPAIVHVVIDEKLAHYVVLYSVKNGNIQYMDPADGHLHTKSLEEFTKIWTNVLVLLVPNENFIEKDDTTSIYKRFWYLLKPHQSVVVQSLFGACIYTILGLSTSIFIQKLVDNVFVNKNTNLLNLMGVIMIVILLLQLFIGATKDVFMLKTGQRMDAQLILGYYKHLLKLPQRFFDTMRVGEIISRINDAAKIRTFINDSIITLIVNVFIVIFSFTLMFIYSWKLALILLIIIPLYSIIYVVTNRLNKKRERKLMEHAAGLESQLVESLNSVKTIKQFGIEPFANIKTETRFIELLKSIYKSSLNALFSHHSSEFLSRVFTIIILWIGTYYVVDNTITPGELLSFYAIIGYFTAPVTQLIGLNKIIQNALIAADRLFEIMDLERENDENKITFSKEMIGDIRFENISFSYGSRVDVFENFSLVIQKSKMTAIIGESGSGKTTIVSLLQKLYPLKTGKIVVGNHNIECFDNVSLRNMVASVPQQLNLFAGNVVENIALGEFNPDMERIVSICTQLGMIDFIEKLPAGFNTYIGENGASLSGGQKQRLAIARALYKNPEILILDEATSALDSESEQFVQTTIDNLRNEGKTIIIIAHRLSTVVNADEIVVLENGNLLEHGSHSKLYKSKGKYWEMWQKQLPVFMNDHKEGTI